jgi:probable phosphoglycerate mutase
MIRAAKTRLSLYLVRHGQTAWSLTGQHTGRTDIPLTAHGEDEARALAPWLGHIEFARVFTSPRVRARRTCELAGLGAGAEVEPDLAEWDYGDYEGKTSSDIRRESPGWTIFRDGCPGGESPADIAARADRLIARLDAMEGNVALFSHGHFGPSFAARWIGLPVVEGQHLSLGTASLNILGYNPDHPEIRMITLWNASPALLRGLASTA